MRGIFNAHWVYENSNVNFPLDIDIHRGLILAKDLFSFIIFSNSLFCALNHSSTS